MGAFLLFAAGFVAWGQANGFQTEVIQDMIRIVLENNPTLASQQTLVRQSEKLPNIRSPVALTGMNLSFSVWNLNASTYQLYPTATVGTSISIADPVRMLNSFNLKKEREQARQEYLKTKDALTADLLGTVRELLKLSGRRESLERLKVDLRDYIELLDRQVRAGADSSELAKLWDLKERLLDVEAESEDVGNQLGTMRLEAAMRLAGDSWRELLELFSGLSG